MAEQAALPAPGRKPYIAIARAIGRSWWSQCALPPGDLAHIDRLERGDRTLLLGRAARYGPVFKGLAENRLLVCVLGLAAGRRLLKAHAASLRPVTLELASLFPLGFMRQMEGDAHRAYRKALVRALGDVDLPALEPAFDTLAADVLAVYAEAPASQQAWSAALARIASSMLVRVFFGAPVGSGRHGRLLEAYQRLGPHGLVWNITPRQAAAFAALRPMPPSHRGCSAAPRRKGRWTTPCSAT
jgi:cytochrome P450